MRTRGRSTACPLPHAAFQSRLLLHKLDVLSSGEQRSARPMEGPIRRASNSLPMTWSRRFAIRESVRGSLWLLPLIGAVLGGVFGSLMLLVDHSVDVPSYWQYSPSTASTLLS